MEGTYILIVDDESRMRKLLRDFLSAKGYQILEAEDGEKALEVYEENITVLCSWDVYKPAGTENEKSRRG